MEFGRLKNSYRRGPEKKKWYQFSIILFLCSKHNRRIILINLNLLLLSIEEEKIALQKIEIDEQFNARYYVFVLRSVFGNAGARCSYAIYLQGGIISTIIISIFVLIILLVLNYRTETILFNSPVSTSVANPRFTSRWPFSIPPCRDRTRCWQ